MTNFQDGVNVLFVRFLSREPSHGFNPTIIGHPVTLTQSFDSAPTTLAVSFSYCKQPQAAN